MISNIQIRAQNIKYELSSAKLTGKGGLSFVAYLAKTSGLVGVLEDLNSMLRSASAVRRKHRQYCGRCICYLRARDTFRIWLMDTGFVVV